MSNKDMVSMAVRSLFKRKLRTFLTVLGVIIGTASIVIMISLGIGVNMSFEEQMKNMGDVTKIQIYNYNAYYGGDASAKKLTDADIDAMEKLEGVQAATPMLQTDLFMAVGKYYAEWVQIYGIRPSAMEAFGYKVGEGETLSEEGDKYQIVFGSDIPYQFMSARERSRSSNRNRYYGPVSEESAEREPPNVDVLKDKVQASFVYGFWANTSTGGEENTGSTVKAPKPYKLKGMGILEAGNNWENSYYSFMNINTVKQIIAERTKYEQSMNSSSRAKQEDKGYYQALVKCTDINKVEETVEKIKEMGFTDVYSPMDYVNFMKETTGSLQALLGAIGAVSLFVAAIGIANTMVMSIYERTKEIGIMKVIGASIKDVRRLFLMEAAIIGLLGGIFGIGLSFIVSYVLNNVGISFLSQLTWSEDSTVSYIPVWLAMLSLVFSAIVGLISGFFPAVRATKVSALTAIRTE